MKRLYAVALKELRQLRRDPLTISMMIVIPIIQLLVFGYAINTDVRNIPTLVFDQDQSAASRRFVRSLEATGFHTLVGEVDSYDGVTAALRDNTARVALVVPRGYARTLGRRERATLQLVVDGSDPQIVASATQSATGLAAAQSALLRVDRWTRTSEALITVEPTLWYNPELRTAVFVVPGIIGVILTMTMVMLTSMAIARERERGTLEALIVSPLRSTELMIGKLIPYVAIGYVQITLVLLVGRVIFDVPFEGSLALLYALSFVFIAANLALGLVFSTLAKTQQQAMQMSFFFLLPNILLSGFAFPFEGMPRPAQWLAELLPLTHYLRIVRGISLKSAHFGDLDTDLLWMTGAFLAFVTLASLRFRKKLI